MLTIALNDLKFYAYHGVYEEEKRAGNHFIVDCSVSVIEPEEIPGGLEDTVNYQALYELIKENMLISESLLETVCMKTGRQILSKFPRVQSVSISIKKINPPINGFTGSASVCWQSDR